MDAHTVIEQDNSKTFTIGNIQNRSEAAQEIISRKPDFMEKWALFLFMGILLVLFTETWFIRYPDIVQTRATLSAYNGPKEVVPLQTGRLTKLFAKNGQEIQQGETIAWIESSSSTEEVLKLSVQLDSATHLLSLGTVNKVYALFNQHFEHLGILQSAYQTYSTALQQFNDYLVNGFYAEQKNSILSDMSAIDQMNVSLGQQKELTEKDNELFRQTFVMNEQLYKEKVISAEEYRQEQSKLVNKQMAIPQINSGLLSNQNQQRDKRKELRQLDHDVAQQKSTFEQALQTLKSNVEDWKHQYIITAPIAGTLFFNQPVQQNQFWEQGKLLGYINPWNSRFYAQVYLPQNNLGKIDSGMSVQLRFDAYPYQEFGFVKGKLDYISKIASDSGYLAIVSLDNGLETNQHKVIQYKNGLKANALVITKNLRLMQRFYYNIVKEMNMNKQ
ncbi:MULTISPECIES: HlyD family secretion protein [Chitinophagaceae]